MEGKDSFNIKLRRSAIIRSTKDSSKKTLNSNGRNTKNKADGKKEGIGVGRKKKRQPSLKDGKLDSSKCPICMQVLNDPGLRFYGGHPKDAAEEEKLINNPYLSLSMDDEKTNERLQMKITCFTIYDAEGHLCPFDAGLIEKGISLFFSGYVKAIYEEGKDIEGGIPAKDLGPITGWWISGFDGGENAVLAFSTALGDYILMEPSVSYAPFMDAVMEKIFISKIVIEFLCGSRGNGGDTYEELLKILQNTVAPEKFPPLSEEKLVIHAQFVCEQVRSFDMADKSDLDPLLKTPCMQRLLQIAGVTFSKRGRKKCDSLEKLHLEKKLKVMSNHEESCDSDKFKQITAENDEKVKDRKRQQLDVSQSHPKAHCSTSALCKDKKNTGRIQTRSKLGSTVAEIEKPLSGGKLGTVSRCSKCKQMLLDNPDLHFYAGHPSNAASEEEALKNPQLSLFSDQANNIDTHDEKPQNKITGFSVFDEEEHLCPFDNGLIEDNVLLYFSGHLKPIYADDKDVKDGIPVQKAGPIRGWWLFGFDGGESALIGFSTDLGEYILMEPSENYTPFVDAVKEKIFLSKVVIEFLCGERGDGGQTYEDLLRTIQATIPPADFPSLTEEGLLDHAQFVCEQVRSFDEADSTDLDTLLMMPCMQTLIKLGGVRFGKRQKVLSCVSKDLCKKVQLTKATTTPLVKEIFEMFFRDKIKLEHHEKIQVQKNRPCGICETCQKPDCGTCMPCRDMLKFGGSGLSKQTCIFRKRCPEMKIHIADSSEDVHKEDNTQRLTTAETRKSEVVQNFKNNKRTYYSNSKSTTKEVERLTAKDKRISGPSKCLICSQVLHNNEDLKFYKGHPKGAVKEKTVLEKPCISSLLGDNSDEKPQVKITGFTVYDKRGHLCQFDTGLIENGVKLYFSGYVKPIYEENKEIEGGIPARDLGSIKGWWISGFDGGESVIIGFSTELGEYILMEPSKEYAPFMAALKEKIFLSKVVIEFLCGERGDGGHTYEDLLRTIQMASPPADVPPLTEERLLNHAQFVCDQVRSFDEADVTDFEPLLNTSCMQSLINFGCVTFTERLLKRKIMEVEDSEDEDSESEDEERSPIKNLRTHVSGSKRTVTWVGDNVFKRGIKTYYKEVLVEGVGEIEAGSHVLVQPQDPSTPCFVARVNYLWGDNDDNKMFHAVWYYRSSETVLGEGADPTELFCTDECEDVSLKAIVKKVKVFHYKHPEDWANLGGIVDGSEIQKHFVSEGKCKDGEEILWFQKRYDKIRGRFEDLLPDPSCKNPGAEYSFCSSCERLLQRKIQETPRVYGKLQSIDGCNEVSCDAVHYLNEEFRRGTFVFIDPAKVPWKLCSLDKDVEARDTPKEVDEDLYPEHYRKYLSCGVRRCKKIKRSRNPTPYMIGCVIFMGTKQCLSFDDSKFETEADIWLDVNIFYRPEDTKLGVEETYLEDLNLLYWTRDRRRVEFKSVVRKCHVVYGGNVEGFKNPDSLQHWSSLGPNRFYFLQAYDPEANIFYDPPAEAKSIGKVLEGNGQGMEEKREDEPKVPKMEEWPAISQPLRTLDVFAGCGGLSNGLHQSGVATTKWAIEKNEADANTFRLNNPNCSVFIEDCNDFLHNVISGKTMNERGQRLPRKGEVELLCGGPPCQGFSLLNRFKSGEDSLYRNSLIASFLSFCDYYRPRFFILENVRNLVSYDRNMVLKLTLRCLLRMGYQCSFAVLQAGNFEIPQSRKRVIILAAAPGEILPRYPLPMNVFVSTGCYLSVKVDGEIYVGDLKRLHSAPFRAITIRDAISDLPNIQNGSNLETMSYGGKPLSHFQRQVRGSQKELKNHICRLMPPMSECRIAHIPPGCDWRDLPNIVVRLSDGRYTKKLVYNHDDIRVGRSANGALRGVCVCATGKKKCDPMDRQTHTLIPWCFPHTANRQAHWPNGYGRLDWNKCFPTIITNPEPLGKQGRVLHPEQNRVVSVRECARSQGFMDSYQFYGNITDKYRQIGNAVPPPMGKAIGFEIRTSVSLKENK